MINRLSSVRTARFTSIQKVAQQTTKAGQVYRQVSSLSKTTTVTHTNTKLSQVQHLKQPVPQETQKATTTWKHPLLGNHETRDVNTTGQTLPLSKISNMIIDIQAIQSAKVLHRNLLLYKASEFEDFQLALNLQQRAFERDVSKIDTNPRTVKIISDGESNVLSNISGFLSSRLQQHNDIHKLLQERIDDCEEVRDAIAKQATRTANLRLLINQFKATVVNDSVSNVEPTKHYGDIYFAFFALMARIIRQVNDDAHQLYQVIKERTDQIDLLSDLKAKINNAGSGTIDWSNDPAMKQLIDEARKLGVAIPEGKYKFTEKEREALKENIQMKKDNLDKMTQIERVTLQKYMHEIGECHQARSNTLKARKQVADTIIHNFAP